MPDERRNRTFSVRVPESTFEAIQQLAKDAGVSQSDLIIALVNERLGQPSSDARLDELERKVAKLERRKR